MKPPSKSEICETSGEGQSSQQSLNSLREKAERCWQIKIFVCVYDVQYVAHIKKCTTNVPKQCWRIKYLHVVIKQNMLQRSHCHGKIGYAVYWWGVSIWSSRSIDNRASNKKKIIIIFDTYLRK